MCIMQAVSAQAAQSAPAEHEPVRVFHLYATDGEHVTADGRTLYIWGYSLQDQPGTATLPAPLIEVHEGELVEIVLTNLGPSRDGVHPFPHTIHLHGLDVDQANDGVPETSPSARVGHSVTYRFRAPHAGTYWYHCHVETIEHLTMGMYGALVVHPPEGPGRAWARGPDYDRAYTLVLSEADPTWHDAIADNRTPDRTRHHPTYFFINGRSFPDTMHHSDTHLGGHLGDRLLVRLVNAGYGWRSMHMHGFHFEVIASDGRPLPQPYLKDTLSIAPGERYDLLVTLDQLGAYPFHSHAITDNLNDGAYPGGIHTMITVVAPDRPLPQGHDDHATTTPEEARPAPVAPTPVVRRLGGFPIARASAPASSSPPLPSTVPDGAVLVEMRDDRFVPEYVTIATGTTVGWVNHDPRSHTVEARTFAGPDVPRHGAWSYTFDTPGTIVYECVIHRGMTGVITVR
jgi:manganese oxidase